MTLFTFLVNFYQVMIVLPSPGGIHQKSHLTLRHILHIPPIFLCSRASALVVSLCSWLDLDTLQWRKITDNKKYWLIIKSVLLSRDSSCGVDCILHISQPKLPAFTTQNRPKRQFLNFSSAWAAWLPWGCFCDDSSTRWFSLNRFCLSTRVLIFAKYTKARVTRACDIYHCVSQPVVTLSFVSRHDQSEAQDSPADQSEAGPGSVPRHVIGCIRSITVWVTRTRVSIVYKENRESEDIATPAQLRWVPLLVIGSVSAYHSLSYQD